jgi:hypothetical protein
MKNHTMTMFLALGAACVFGSALDAQSSDFAAKVPFGFQIAGKAFPAGKYLVAEHGQAVSIPSVQNMTTGEKVFVPGADHSLTRVGTPSLVFHCYAGNTCYLAEIRPPAGAGSHVAMSKAEKEVARGDHPPEMATISVDARRAD